VTVEKSLQREDSKKTFVRNETEGTVYVETIDIS